MSSIEKLYEEISGIRKYPYVTDKAKAVNGSFRNNLSARYLYLKIVGSSNLITNSKIIHYHTDVMGLNINLTRMYEKEYVKNLISISYRSEDRELILTYMYLGGNSISTIASSHVDNVEKFEFIIRLNQS